MTVFVLVMIAILVLYFRTKPKKEPEIDIIKNSDYYLKEFPFLSLNEPKEPEKPNVIINITHNHLHIHNTTYEDLRN